MAARLLRHYNGGIAIPATGAQTIVGAAVAAARALVGLVTLTNAGVSTLTVSLSVGAGGGGGNVLANGLPLPVGEQFEQRVVVPAGEAVFVSASGGAAGDLRVNVMGEEVDN